MTKPIDPKPEIEVKVGQVWNDPTDGKDYIITDMDYQGCAWLKSFDGTTTADYTTWIAAKFTLIKDAP